MELWTQEQYFSLLQHLHGNAPPDNFAFSFVPQDADQAVFVHNKTRTIDDAMSSSWDSICNKTCRPYSLVLLPTKTGESCWATWDFDFHDDPKEALGADMLRNLLTFVRAAESLSQEGIHYLVEHSGNGWHCWLIADRPMKAKEWHGIRKKVELSAGFSGKPEFLPCFGGAGKGCRAPGSSNPKTWHITREDWQQNLIFKHSIPSTILQQKRRIPVSLSCSPNQAPAGTNQSWHESYVETLQSKCAITGPHERHNRLLTLVGEGCFSLSKKVLYELATQLHQRAKPPCATGIEEHLADFELVYAGAWQKLILPRLSEHEQNELKAFKNSSERDVFIICQNHARHGNGDFYFSTKHVGTCTGLSFGRVAQIRKHFIAKGLIRKLPGGYIPGRKALSFRWLLPMLQGS